MIRNIVIALIATATLTPGLAVAAKEKDNQPPPGFKALFDGKTFKNWKVPAGDNGHWKIVNGVIDYDAQSEAKGDKSLWTQREFKNFVVRVDWRIKETPYVNPNTPYVLPDGTHARRPDGKPLRIPTPDSDSGIFIRGASKAQINIWCWPIGSGEVYGYRNDKKLSAAVRKGVTPKVNADKPIGRWNRFEITMRGELLTVVLNGKKVLDAARLPGVAPRGPIALQHHGDPIEFANLLIKELPTDAAKE